MFRGPGLSFFVADQGKFARIEPVAAAIRALIHFHAAFGAKEMAVKLHPGTAGTFAFTGWVHDDALIALEVKQGFPGGLAFFIDLLQFKAVEPNPTTTALASVQDKMADL